MKDKDKPSLAITNQFRARDAMVYEMRCEGVRLTVTMTPRKSEDDAGEWHVEARAGRSPEDKPVFAEWGNTRMEALRAVGRMWTEQRSLDELNVDWEAVAKVLSAVRAL